MLHTQEGEQLLDGEKREKTRAQTAATKEEQTPPKVKRATTIAQTAEVHSMYNINVYQLCSV